jgi:hypothetical protein
MPVRFEGFPRLLERGALRAGRWFVVAGPRNAAVCFATDIGAGAARTILTFRPAKLDGLDFLPLPLAELPGTLTTLEDELVLSPGEGPRALRLFAPSKRPFLSGSLLRLRDGELGIGYADRSGGELVLVSLTTGAQADGFELVFDRWSLSLRRGDTEQLVGAFRPTLAVTSVGR